MFGIKVENPLEYWKEEIGEGWHPLLESFVGLTEFDAKQGYAPEVELQQVKQKFGGLRIYYSGGNERTDHYVRMAEQVSLRVCEECGKAASMRSIQGWYRTLCEDHIA